MKNLNLLLISLIAAFSFSAKSATLIPSTNSAFCGDYQVRLFDGSIGNLQILKPSQFHRGVYVALEEKKLKEFLEKWTSYFGDKGENVFKFKSICYGIYDDIASKTGPNAVAIGDRHMLLGTGMLALIQTKVDDYIQQMMITYGGVVPSHELAINPSAAKNFLLLHEFGHLIQSIYGRQFSGLTAREKELNADCIAAYLYTTEQTRSFNASDFFNNSRSASLYAFALGDLHLNDSNHHGTHEERLGAFMEGMSMAIINFQNGVELGSRQILDSCSVYFN